MRGYKETERKREKVPLNLSFSSFVRDFNAIGELISDQCRERNAIRTDARLILLHPHRAPTLYHNAQRYSDRV